jgi:hypothetical protein
LSLVSVLRRGDGTNLHRKAAVSVVLVTPGRLGTRKVVRWDRLSGPSTDVALQKP